MILPLLSSAPLARRTSRLTLRLLMTTALVSCLLPGRAAYAQVVIGDQPQPDVEIFRPQPALPTHGEWPYNVKTSKSLTVQKPIDPNTLPSRQVNEQILQAAHLQQSGLTPAQVREAMATPAASALPTDIVAAVPPMQVPMLAGDKPATPRDSTTSLPAVATGPLMASLADGGNGSVSPISPANDSAPPVPIAMADAPLVAPMPAAIPMPEAAALPDSLPNSMASLSESTVAPTPELTTASPSATAVEPVKSASSGRALFGGRKLADQDRMQVAAAAADTKGPAANELGAPPAMAPSPAAEMIVASPAAGLDVDPAPTPPMAAPRDTASNSTPAQIAPLTSLSSAPPKLLARIGDTSRGTVQRPNSGASATANNSTGTDALTPLATPRQPVDTAPIAAVANDQPTPAPVSTPVSTSLPTPLPVPTQPEPSPAPAALLPAKVDEPAAPLPTPQPFPEPSPPEPNPPQPNPPQPNPPEQTAVAPIVIPAASPSASASASASASPTPASTAPRKGFWSRMFGSDEDQPKPAVATPAPIPQAISAPAVAATPTPAPIAAEDQAEPPTKLRYVDGPAADLPAADLSVAAVAPVAVPPVFEPIPAAGLAAPAAKADVPAEPAPRPKPEDRERLQPQAVQPAVMPVPQAPSSTVAPTTAPVITTVPTAITAPAMVAPAEPLPTAPTVANPAPVPIPAVMVDPMQPLPPTQLVAQPVAVMQPQAIAEPVYAPAIQPVMQPVMMPATIPAPTPMFRVEAPANPGAAGLVTPRLVPVTQATAAAAVPLVTKPDALAPLAQIAFLPASQSVDSVGQAQLQAIAEAMQMGPQSRLLLNAYAEASNESESRRISLNRALVVRSKLAELGIQPSRIDVQALGEKTPSHLDGGHDRVDAILH